MDPKDGIRQGSVWVYVGPGGGAGVRHAVIEVGPDVVTWSEPVYGKSEYGIAGWSWHGTALEFLKSFKST